MELELELDEMMREAFMLKARMDADKARLAKLNAQIAGLCTFEEGSKTARLAVPHYQAKVQKRETVSWNQEGLYKAIHAMGTTEFQKVFKFTYEPKSAKALTSWLASPDTPDDWRKLVLDARQVKSGSPSVSIEYIGEE